ncbi:TIGR02234 family membrane protein [Gordonia sp. VNK21]|uniref:TIGR02234 family membrane protein n=1 Tax=Gordonia sp. VNK21 TaxID=3382483 RepID=UPI0038D3B419
MTMSQPQSQQQPQHSPPTPAGPDPESRKRARRWQAVATVFLLLAAIGLWAASRMVWAQVHAFDGLSSDEHDLAVFDVLGSDWSPWLTAVAIALLAAIAVVFAVRGWALRVVAVLVALAGVAVAVPAISLIRDGDENLYAARVADMPGRYEVFGVDAKTWPGVLVLAAAACAVLAAIAILRAANRAAGMSSKYTSPAARREELERKVFAEREQRAAQRDDDRTAVAGTERELWDALDNGVDPTGD